MVKQEQGRRLLIVNPLMSDNAWKTLWQLKMQDRLKLILWKIAAEALPIRATILYRLGATNKQEMLLHPMCENHIETAMLECIPALLYIQHFVEKFYLAFGYHPTPNIYP